MFRCYLPDTFVICLKSTVMRNIPRYITLSLCLVASLLTFSGSAQPYNGKRPKLVVGLMVDQMRWDFLYRYYDRYTDAGFKRLIQQGFSAENTMIPYAQTVTAAGHACVYTGSIPAVNGIMGNEWYDKQLQKEVYCVEDESVKIIGGVPASEPMSPRNLWTTTISDELRLATNFRSKVIGVAIKDRGSILPAGHTGTAYWYEGGNGNWVSSTWYMNELPAWVQQFNARRWVDSLYKNDWNTLYPISTYVQSDSDNVAYEGRSAGDTTPTFPHRLRHLIGKNYGAIRSTPMGNTLTLSFAKEAMTAEQLGKDAITDLLAISLSSPDYIGHQYGPNSIEIEDNYLRLDRELAEFFAFLDKEVGKGEYLLFITADHGVAHVPAFLKKNKVDVKTIPSNISEINNRVEAKFGFKNALVASANYHLYLNALAIDSLGKDKAQIEKFITSELNKLPHLWGSFSYNQMESVALPVALKEKFISGYNQKRSGDVQLVLKSGYFYGGATGTTHGSWYPYDAHIPLVFMGWGVTPGRTNRTISMSDIAPTLAAMLRIQMPSGTTGTPITEMLPVR
jgi:predicted AlkP superfamily pyrophosphatase or phosphodiesterase